MTQNLKMPSLARYSAARKQFGPSPDVEVPVLEYQLQVRSQQHVVHPLVMFPWFSLQQWRLLPYLATAFLLSHYGRTIYMDFAQFIIGKLMGDKSQQQVQPEFPYFGYNYIFVSFIQSELGRELHALSCASKSLAGFLVRDGIQECREACGGHGYLAGACMQSYLVSPF